MYLPTYLRLSDEGIDPATAFGQLPGDGGLVKGVLAHVAALAGKENWKRRENE